MTTDQKLRDASASIREARRHADFTVEAPGRAQRLNGARIALSAAVVVLLVVGLPLVALNMSGETGGDVAVTEAPETTVADVETSVQAAPTPPSDDVAAVDITDLVVSVGVSSELSSLYEAKNLIDGDLARSWQDASLSGVGATITFLFDQPVAISHLVIYPLSSEERFRRNFKVQGFEVTVDDDSLPLFGRLRGTFEAQRVDVGSSATTVLTLSVTTTHPAESVGDQPPFKGLAIAEIRVFGEAPDGLSVPLSTLAPIDAAEPPPVTLFSLVFESPVLDVRPVVDVSGLPFSLDPYIENAMSGEVPVELRGQLLIVSEEVMLDLGALPLGYRSFTSDPGLTEDADFLFRRDSNLIISIVWREWDGRTESNPLGFSAGALREQWGGDSVFIDIQAGHAHFGAVNDGALKVVSFSTLDSALFTSEGLQPFTITEAEMREIAAAVFEVMKP